MTIGKEKIRIGDSFSVVLRKGAGSKTLAGAEKAGKNLGVFKVDKISNLTIEAVQQDGIRRIFNFRDFVLTKIG